MKRNFDILFEDIMNNISDKELYGNDIHNSIVKIYKFNTSTNTFDNLLVEIDNFKFLEPNSERLNIIEDLTMDLEDADSNFDICKIEIFDKETNKLLFDGITFYGNDSNEIIDLLSYTENPRGVFQGSPTFNTLYEEAIANTNKPAEVYRIGKYIVKFYLNPDYNYTYKVFENGNMLIDSAGEDYGYWESISDALTDAKNWINDWDNRETVNEDSDSFDNTFNQETGEYNGYKINISNFDDQGDIVYTWSIHDLNNDNGAIVNDDSYYNSFDEALKYAKLNVNNLINNIAPVYKPKAKPIANINAYKGSRFNELFESTELTSEYSNEEYIHDYNYEINDNNYKIVIVKVTEDDSIYYEYMIGTLDNDGNIIDWPLFESSNNFETDTEARSAAEDYIIDYENDSI